MSESDSLRRNPMTVNPDITGKTMTEQNTIAVPHPDHLAPMNDLNKDVVGAPPKVEGARGFGGS